MSASRGRARTVRDVGAALVVMMLIAACSAVHVVTLFDAPGPPESNTGRVVVFPLTPPADGLPGSGPAIGVRAISAGGRHTCALTASAGVACWGYNRSGELATGTIANSSHPVVVSGLPDHLTAVSSGDSSSCALTAAGAVWCWGANGNGQLGTGGFAGAVLKPVMVQGLSGPVVAVSTGDFHACALTQAGGVECWGGNRHGDLGNGDTIDHALPVGVTGLDSGVRAIAAGGNVNCALVDEDGTVTCWGDNVAGEVGNGLTGRIPAMGKVKGLSGIRAISAGLDYACALTTESGVRCWGSNAHGQLGDGTFADSAIPVDVVGLAHGVRAISAGAGHACALLRDATVACWGRDFDGELGNGRNQASGVPVAVSGLDRVTAIGAGGMHSCATVATGAIKCWGYDGDGQLGDGSPALTGLPVPVLGLTSGMTAIASGGNHTCAIAPDGTVACWGHATGGDLGDGANLDRYRPVSVRDLPAPAIALALGDKHSCALTKPGAVACWGYNGDGELGDGSTADSATAIAVAGLSHGVLAIGAGDVFTCALTSAGGVKCWGDNAVGELGLAPATLPSRSVPGDVPGLTSGVTAIAVGGATACALTSAGGVKCWGNNQSGQLGTADGVSSGTFSAKPLGVKGLSRGVLAITVGRSHACAIDQSRHAICWGNNLAGQLGNAGWNESSRPGVVAEAGEVTDIVAGAAHTCVREPQHRTYCWGNNLFGELGDDAIVSETVPVRVVGLPAETTALALGGDQTCAIVVGGAVWCWGYDGRGELGNGTVTHRLLPVDVIAVPR